MAVGDVIGLLGEDTPTALLTVAGMWASEVSSEVGAGVMVSTSDVASVWSAWRITMSAPTRMMAITMSPRAT